MSGTTAVYGLPYLELDDAPDIAGATQDLAEAVETELQRIDSTPQPVEDFEGANDTAASTTYVTGTVHGVAFVAPPSGKVKITFGGWIGNNAVSGANPVSYLSDEVLTGATVGSGSVVAGWAASDVRAIPYHRPNTDAGFKYDYAQLTHLVVSLTPGASYNVVTKFRSTVAASAAVNARRLLVEPVL